MAYLTFASPLFWVSVLALYPAWAFLRGRFSAALLLAGFSAGFLFLNEPAALAALLATGIVAWGAGLALERVSQEWVRLSLLAACVAAFTANIALLRLSLGWVTFGISYFSFQAIGYLVDIHRREQRAERRPFYLLLSFGAFFHVSAGPVVRSSLLLPQLRGPAAPTAGDLTEGLYRILSGLAKKAMAESLGALSAGVLVRMEGAGWVRGWTAMLAQAGQFYADFSGYTDIAIGLALLFGLRLPENFRTPFLAASPADHWRRWHISLCDWFLRYVFAPLSLVRVPFSPKARIAASVMVTMALIGLWHGLTLNNLLWGLYNGALIIGSQAGTAGLAVPVALRVLVTFYLLLLGRILTCTPGLGAAAVVLREMHGPAAVPATASSYVNLSLAILGLIVPHTADHLFLRRRELFRSGPVVWGFMFLLMVGLLMFASPGKAFLYER